MYYDSCVGNTLSLYEHKNVTDYSSNNINHNNTHTHTTLTLLCMSSGGAFRSSGLMKRVQLDSNSALLSSPLRFIPPLSPPVFHPLLLRRSFSVNPFFLSPLRSHVFCSYSSHRFLFYEPPHLHPPRRPRRPGGHAAVN